MGTKREQGFTLIELLIISIIVGILATLVAMTYSGVQAKNRNANRQASIDTVQSQLETYYAQYSKYPSIVDLNSSSWRKTNLKDLHEGDVKDPRWSKDIKNCTVNGQPGFSSKPNEKCYSYQAVTADGSACSAADVTCTQYTLTAILEGGEKYVKSSLN
jgi:prepilin-type N-terminal cleavage/methylation domain-containing protein